MSRYKYVLITAAHNESEYIERTLTSMVNQTVPPEKWVIVSDGSTDDTDNIVMRWARNMGYIELIRMEERRERSFSGKAACFSAGYERVKNVEYEVIGNLDADISFDKSYFEFLLSKFAEISNLGVAGTPFLEEGYSSIEDGFEGERHVPGGVQLFRRRCFEEIGGYVAIKGGGIDWIAVTTARMKGWKTQSFGEKRFFHHRHLGTGGSNRLGANFSYGLKDYYLGGHPLWEGLRVFYRMSKRPYIVGSVFLMLGYVWGIISAMERPVSKELMKFHRDEQMTKLRGILKQMTRRKKVEKFHTEG